MFPVHPPRSRAAARRRSSIPGQITSGYLFLYCFKVLSLKLNSFCTRSISEPEPFRIFSRLSHCSVIKVLIKALCRCLITVFLSDVDHSNTRFQICQALFFIFLPTFFQLFFNFFSKLLSRLFPLYYTFLPHFLHHLLPERRRCPAVFPLIYFPALSHRLSESPPQHPPDPDPDQANTALLPLTKRIFLFSQAHIPAPCAQT